MAAQAQAEMLAVVVVAELQMWGLMAQLEQAAPVVQARRLVLQAHP